MALWIPWWLFQYHAKYEQGYSYQKQPLGKGTLKREIVGNKILERTLHLCELLHPCGSFFALENPFTSFAWKIPKLKKLSLKTRCSEATMDQCGFNLQMPGPDGVKGLAKKPTRFLGTMPNWEHLGLRCNNDHCHVAVIGGVKVQGRWQKNRSWQAATPLLCAQPIQRPSKRHFGSMVT